MDCASAARRPAEALPYPQPDGQDEEEVQDEDSDVYGFQCVLRKRIRRGHDGGARRSVVGALHGCWSGRHSSPSRCIYLGKSRLTVTGRYAALC